MIKTEAGEKMKKENPNKELPEKADINKDGEFQAWEKARHEAIQAAKAEMNCGGLMGDGMGVIIGIEAESGNEIPAGSNPEEVADDIPAMLSEGEYVVPADVVRWHGVKTFEALRGEAKMGMGLMAQDGRIAEVDDETKKPVDYDIEEKDKPEVEKAEVEVVHAATGVDVTPDTTTPEPPTTYYSYKWTLDPETNRYRMVPVDPDSGQVVTSETFDPTRSTRYAPRDVLAREVYGRPLGEPEKDQECPEGTVYDEEIGACVPVEPASVTQPTGLGGEGDGAPAVGGRVDYASQPLTKLAETLGPLSAEDLADYEGETLADKAVSRMMTPATEIGTGGFGVLGLVGSGVKNLFDNVGARRAAETRAQEFAKDPLGLTAYNFNFDPSTGSFKETSASTKVTDMQDGWITDYNNIGRSGTEYTRDEVFGSDIDDPNSAINDVFDSIDDDLANITAVTGGGRENMFGDNEGTDSSPTSSGGSRTTDAADVDSGRGGMGPSGSGPSGGGGSDNDNDNDNSGSSGGSSDSFGGGRDSDGWGE